MTHTYLVLLPISHLSPRMPVPGCAPVMNPSSTPCQPMLSAVDSDARIDVVGAARLAAQPPTPLCQTVRRGPQASSMRPAQRHERRSPPSPPGWGPSPLSAGFPPNGRGDGPPACSKFGRMTQTPRSRHRKRSAPTCRSRSAGCRPGVIRTPGPGPCAPAGICAIAGPTSRPSQVRMPASNGAPANARTRPERLDPAWFERRRTMMMCRKTTAHRSACDATARTSEPLATRVDCAHPTAPRADPGPRHPYAGRPRLAMEARRGEGLPTRRRRPKISWRRTSSSAVLARHVARARPATQTPGPWPGATSGSPRHDRALLRRRSSSQEVRGVLARAQGRATLWRRLVAAGRPRAAIRWRPLRAPEAHGRSVPRYRSGR